MKYILGLDVGIASVGWGLINLDENDKPNRIIDLGVRIFEPGEDAQTGKSLNLNRREKRGTRRLIRRKNFRLDRVRLLLNNYGFIKYFKEEEEELSDYLERLKKETEKIINNYYKGKNTNPYILKVKGLEQKLTEEELIIILLHYAKYRGYKSNRQDTDDTQKSTENKKVLASIKENETILKKYRSVSEMLIKDEKFKERIHNTTDNYTGCISREIYEHEINMLLDKQIELGLINHDFKNEYLKIWKSQRDFSEGPGGNSKYGGNLIERMTGKCKFTGEPRAPKYAPSVEKFKALQALVNLRYYDENCNVKTLTNEQIKQAINILETQDYLTYKKIGEITKIKNITIKHITLSRKEYITLIKNFKTEVLGISEKEQLDFKTCTTEQQKIFNQIKNEKLLKKNFLSMPAYTNIRKNYITQYGKEEWEKIKQNYKLFDQIITILTKFKTEKKIKQAIEELNNQSDIKVDLDFVLSLNNYKNHINISLSLVYQLIPLLEQGYRYDEAMYILNYNHTLPISNLEKKDLLSPIVSNCNINNQRVIRSLTQSRKVINAIIKKYGMPTQINIEVARELAKSKLERKEIEEKQLENKENNEKIKLEIFDKFKDIFKSLENISGTDILKYKLWIEQNETCPYSLEKITIDELFKNNQTQIDHILPYSRTYDDSYLNKTIVKTDANQNKGNRTPYEWFKGTDHWNKYESYILSCNLIPNKKKEYYLNKKLGEEEEREFKERNLNDTKYIATILGNIIRKDLNIEKVKLIKGIITGKLRAKWGLNGLTHSLESPTYYLKDKPNNESENDEENDKKNRDNYLHHAVDACIVAVTNDALIQRITKYEKYKRYLERYLMKQFNNFNDELKQQGFSIDELRTYVNEALNEKFIVPLKNNQYKTYFPMPYAEFKWELIYRVYERDKNILINQLKGLVNYSNVNLNEINPIIPSISKFKRKGGLHKETYYGIREIKDQNNNKVETKLIKTARIPLNSKIFTIDKLENILDKFSGSKEVYESVKEWLKNYNNGEEAFKANNNYPINKKTGTPIKKIKISLSEFLHKGHLIDNKKLVEIDTILKIEVYRKNNDDKLYFLGLDALTMHKIKKNPDNTIVTIWTGQGNNNFNITYTELNQEYIKYIELSKNDFIKVILRNENYSYCYVVGFSSGMFEVKSVLGDGYDLVGTNQLFNKHRKRYHLTVSQIKSIEKINISVLGKVDKKYKNNIFNYGEKNELQASYN